ncbi:MAG: hypothetical protein AB1597_00530 [Chloroflexota bacterium]
MIVVWTIPYAIASFYDFLRGQEFIPQSLPLLSQLIPNWATPLWFMIGALAFIVITFETAYRIVQKERGKSPGIRTNSDGLQKKPRVFDSVLMIANQRVHRCSQCGYGFTVDKLATGVYCPKCGNADNIAPEFK